VRRATVLFDGDCGLCRWSAEKLRRWDRAGALGFATLDSLAADEMLAGMDRETRFDSWHLVGVDGRVWSAGAAIPETLRLLPGGAPLGWLASLSPALTERAYRSVSRHRVQLGRLLGRQACAVDPTRS
jgi:predicted DCC family thiol-disulfide oxidoreductase YuxK